MLGSIRPFCHLSDVRIQRFSSDSLSDKCLIPLKDHTIYDMLNSKEK